MQKQLILSFIFGWVLGSTSMATAGEIHSWNEIAYPELNCNFGNGTALPSIGNAGQTGLQFYLSFSWFDSEETNKDFSHPDGDKIKVRLHYPDGLIVKPVDSTFHGKLSMLFSRFGSRSRSGSFSCVFPWGKNEMHEGWLEIAFPERSYWLEIPYGFTRDPQSTSFPTAKTGTPKLPVALGKIPDNVKIVNWKHISYDLGKIQDGWSLSLYHSNPFDAHSEIVLYRDDTKIGKSRFLWNLYSPRTKLSIKQSDGFVLSSLAKSLRLHNDGMRRSDKFDFNRNPRDDSLRDWGTMIIEIDDKKWTTIMPSSLFKYVHGVADPEHKATLRTIKCQE